MTELAIYSDNAEKAYAEGREPFDLDINFRNGVPDTWGSVNSRKQRGYISAYIKRGTMPLARQSGIEWAEFVLGKRPWNEICAQIEQSIQDKCGAAQFVPQLKQDGGTMKMIVVDLQG